MPLFLLPGFRLHGGVCFMVIDFFFCPLDRLGLGVVGG
nr:MAG TPA: hypothetical protein [Caudoviricetes sp.]